jgi:hypothetical protein
MPASAQTAGSTEFKPLTTGPARDPDKLVIPADNVSPPLGFALSGNQILARTDRLPAVRRERAKHPGSTSQAFVKGNRRWQVSYFTKADPHKHEKVGKEIVQVYVSDVTGKVTATWTGFKVAWTMARGYPGAFGRRASALYIWLPLCALFFFPFFEWRRPLKLLHLDLLMLLGLSVSLAFFSHGKIDWSVPLVYPFLIYLLVRMLALARARSQSREPGEGGDWTAQTAREPLRLAVPVKWLAVGLIFLVGFRIGLNVTNSNVIDVGYSGVVGADRISDGHRLYGHFPSDNEHGDTYGPVNYLAYVPAEQIWPWSGSWDDLPAAHATSVFFDLLTMLLLFLLGRRVRGPSLGIVLAYAWAACPFTLFASNSNSNDAIVAALLTAALLALAHPARRGALTALAGLTKFAPLALAPLFATYGGKRKIVPFAVAFAVAAVLVMVPAFVGGGTLRTFYDRTLSFQQNRGSPFSVWGYYHGLGFAQSAVQAAALALAVLVAFVPRRRDVVTVSALAAAVVIALQLGITHWFYLYVPWFLAPMFVALLGRYAEPSPRPSG